MFKKFIPVLFLVVLPTLLPGQSASWNYSVNSGNVGATYNWIDCTDGTELDGSALAKGNLDDGRWNINWPFNFSVYDENYTTSDNISISTNGFMRFDANANYNGWRRARNYVLEANPSANFGQILCYGISDLNFSSANSRVFTKVTGTAPNRVLTIEFVDIGFYWAADMYADVQVSFYETSNIIVIKAGDNNVTYEGAEMGMHSRVSPYFHHWQDIDNSANQTWIEYIPTIATFYDQTSYVGPPASQPSDTSFSTSAINSGTAHDVLSFKVTDAAGDGVPTKVSKIRIKNAFPANGADWSSCIAGVVLNDGTSDLNVGVTTIDDQYIDFLFNVDEFDVPDGTSVDLTLKIYLNEGTAVEGKTMQFYIDDDNHYWYHDQMGSGFISDFGNTVDVTSKIFVFTVTATQLVFTVNPSEIIHQNNSISPVITVEAQDNAGITDTDFNGTVSLTNSGGLSMTNYTASIVNGVATFPDLQFSQTAGSITLSTSNAHGLAEGTSTETNIAILNVLFSDDFENATQSILDWTVTGSSGVWHVGSQTNDSWGPPSGHSANGVYGTYLDSKYNNNLSAYLESPIIDLAGSADPKVKFWMDMESEDAWDGGTVQIRVKPDAGSPWGSYITINMTDGGYSGNIPNDSDVDGLADNEDGWSGNSPAGEWAEVQIDLFNLSTTGLNAIDASSLIQVRFWFGTDNNTRNYGGWYIDDFEVSYSSFPGLWSTSAATSDWATASNWDDGIVPDSIFVTIPGGAANYPLIDESVNASTLLIKDGGQLTVGTAGNLNLSGDLMIGQGTSGTFEINDGSSTIAGNMYTNTSSSTTISGGTVQFANWAKSSTEELAEGTIALSSGTITASGQVKFADANVNGTMSGDFALNIASDFSISDNVWATPTGGTITLNGTTAAIINAQNGNSVTAFNLQLSNIGGVTFNSSGTIENNLDVFEVTYLSVPAGNTLNVTGNLTLHAIDKERASLIDNENVNVTGSSIVELHTTANTFIYLSSPVSAAAKTIFTIAPWGAANYNFYKYNEANTNANPAYGWMQPSESTLGIGSGYAYYLTSEHIHNVTGGNFNTGDVSIPVYNSGVNPSNSWNLIGNPYPSPVDADAFITANSDADPATGLLTGTIYFWDDDGSGGSNYASADYATFNRAGAVGGGNGKVVNGYIPIGQAFFVQANNNGNVSFNNSMRSSTPGSFFKSGSQQKAVNKNIKLSVVNSNNDYNETLIAFIDDATNGYDNLYDGKKMIGNSNLAFYSMLGEETMAIQALEQIDANTDTLIIIPLGIKIGVGGTHEIKIDSIDKIDVAYTIHIKDSENDVMFELTEDNTFEFTGTAGTYNERFSLILMSTPETEESIDEEIEVAAIAEDADEEVDENDEEGNDDAEEGNNDEEGNDDAEEGNNDEDGNDDAEEENNDDEEGNDNGEDKNDENNNTEINYIMDDAVKIYTARNSLFIVLKNPPDGESSTLNLYDLTGREMFQRDIYLSNKNEIQLNLPSGIYIVRLNSKNILPISKKVVIGQ